MVEPGSNIGKPIMQVNHFELNPLDDRPNRWMSECPLCGGVLTVTRDSKTYEIQPYDLCRLCGQRFEYLDVEDMRRKDGGSSALQGE